MATHEEHPGPGLDLASLAKFLPATANTPEVINAATQLATAATSTHTADYDTAARALTDAIVATTSPALFADAAQKFLASSDLLEAAGERLGIEVLVQATPPGPGATGPEVLRAADALEVATQLRLGGWAPRWDLFALLAAYDGTGPVTYARAAMRVIQACFEHWQEAGDLLPVAHRIADMGNDDAESVSSSDSGVMLARVALLQALRAADHETALRHIDDALVALAAALAHDDRPDAHVTANIARLLQGLIQTQTVDTAVAYGLADGVQELRHLRYARRHWTGDVSATTWAAWTLLADRLTGAQQRFAEPSWLHAVPVIDDLVDLYRTSGSYTGLRRNDDGRAVQVLIAPVIENGFADEVGLFNVLRQRVAEMEAAAEDGTATADELADLPVAIDIRDAAARRLAAGKPVRDPKAVAGAELPADPDNPDNPDDTGAEVRLWTAARRRHRTKLASASLLVNQALERIWSDLDASTDYRDLDGLADAVDLITALLMAFLYDRSSIGPSEAQYLFDASASEEDLARDLRTFVRGSGYLHGVDTEVRHVAGGRVDMRFSFPGFNLYVELKQDSSEDPVPDKTSYVNQAATYQAAEPRVGFLLVLKKTPKKTPPASVNNWAQVVETTDADGAPRHVLAMTLAGARTIPSDM
ncbi:hypothetical protein [Nocardioides sp.]|uniref:hypothetical protein n=1 Tax=Nocardioides sp. TaxID=35761 RepID=UPI00273260F1|nr:hypothetical protein [Nocardioides sp.]MDP3892134.1 hypothetical protein [Nocardioides sp.]